MTSSTRLVIVCALAAAVMVPFVTLHTLEPHLGALLSGSPHGTLRDPHMFILALTVVLSFVPLVGIAGAAYRWGRGALELRRVAYSSEAVVAGEVTYRRIVVPLPVLFTAGLGRCDIYVSTAAEDRLERPALAAALLHESAHRRHGDVWWQFLLHLCRGGFGWVPGVAKLTEQVQLRMECRADDDALVEGASRRDLFDAISLVAAGSDSSTSLAAHGTQFRLERLARVHADVPRPAPAGMAGVLAAALALPVVAHGLLLAFCDVRLL